MKTLFAMILACPLALASTVNDPDVLSDRFRAVWNRLNSNLDAAVLSANLLGLSKQELELLQRIRNAKPKYHYVFAAVPKRPKPNTIYADLSLLAALSDKESMKSMILQAMAMNGCEDLLQNMSFTTLARKLAAILYFYKLQSGAGALVGLNAPSGPELALVDTRGQVQQVDVRALTGAVLRPEDIRSIHVEEMGPTEFLVRTTALVQRGRGRALSQLNILVHLNAINRIKSIEIGLEH